MNKLNIIFILLFLIPLALSVTTFSTTSIFAALPNQSTTIPQTISTTTIQPIVNNSITTNSAIFGYDSYNYTKNPVKEINGNGISLISSLATIPIGKVTNFTLSSNVSISINALKLNLISPTPVTIKAYNSSGHYDTSMLPNPHAGVYTVDVAGIIGNITYTIKYPSNTPQLGLAPYILENGMWVKLSHFINNVKANTLTFNASSDPTFAVDGSASTVFAAGDSNPHSVILTTANANDVVFLIVGGTRGGNVAQTTGIADSGDSSNVLLTWHLIEHTTSGAWLQDAYYAIAYNTLVNDQLKINTGAMNGGMVAFAVSGANIVTPFDPNAGFPYNAGCNSGCGTMEVTGVSTSNANDFIFGSFIAGAGCGCLGATAPFVVLDNWGGQVGGSQTSGVTMNELVTTTQSSISVTISGDSGDPFVGIVEALQKASTPAPPSFTITAHPNPPLISNTIIDVGQISVVNTIIIGGLLGYTSNWFWIAPSTATGLTIGNTVPFTISNEVVATANSVLYVNAISSTQINLEEGVSGNIFANSLVTSNLIYGAWKFNTLIIDANGLGTNTLTTSQNTITINSRPSITSFTQSNVNLDVNQYDTYTVTLSGGTGSFTANFYYTNNGVSANIVTGIAIGGSASNTIQYGAAGTYNINVIITDTGTTTPYIFNGVKLTTSVTSDPSSVSLIASNVIIDWGQTEVFTSTITGGLSPYSYNFMLSNTNNALPIIANQIYLSVASTSNSFTFVIPSTNNALGILTYTANIEDGVTVPLNILQSNTITINKQLLSTGFTASNNPTNEGKTQVLTATISGGSSTYTYNFLVYNSAGLVTNMLIVGNAFTQNILSYVQSVSWGTGLFTANLFVTDSASTPVTVSNTLTYQVGAIAANPNPPLVSNVIIDVGQISVVNTIIIGGFVGYTSNWFWIAPNIMSGSSSSGNIIPFTISNSGTANVVLIFNAISSSQINLQTTTNIITNTLSTGTANNALGVWNINAFVIDGNGLGINSLITNQNTITVNPQFLGSSIVSSNSVIDLTQWETLTYAISGGTSTYTYNFLVVNTAVSPANIVANVIYTGCTLTTNSFSFLLSSSNPNAVGTLTIFANALDSASTPANFLMTNTITVYSTPTIALTMTPSNSVITGTTVTVNALVSGGSGVFGFQFTINNINAVNTLIGTNGASNIINWGIGSYTYNVIATDTQTTTPFILSQISNVLLVSSATAILPIACNFAIATVSINTTQEYQNTNQGNLMIMYVVATNAITGNVGIESAQPLQQVLALSEASNSFNMSGNLDVPPLWYFSFIYNSVFPSPKFVAQCFPIGGGSSGGGGGFLYSIAPQSNGGFMIGDTFAILAIMLFAIRVYKYNDKNPQLLAITVFAGAFMGLAGAFYTFPPITTTFVNATTSNVPQCTSSSCNSIIETTNAIVNSRINMPIIQSYQIGQIWLGIILFLMILLLFALRDILSIIDERKKPKSFKNM